MNEKLTLEEAVEITQKFLRIKLEKQEEGNYFWAIRYPWSNVVSASVKVEEVYSYILATYNKIVVHIYERKHQGCDVFASTKEELKLKLGYVADDGWAFRNRLLKFKQYE